MFGSATVLNKRATRISDFLERKTHCMFGYSTINKVCFPSPLSSILTEAVNQGCPNSKDSTQGPLDMFEFT